MCFVFSGSGGVSGGVRRGVDFGGSPGWVPVPGNPGIPRQSSGPGELPSTGDPDQEHLVSPSPCELPPVALHVLGDTAREARVLTAMGE